MAVDVADPAQRGERGLSGVRAVMRDSVLQRSISQDLNSMPNVSATARFVTAPSVMLTARAIGRKRRAASADAVPGDVQGPRQRHIAQGVRARTANRARHVRDA